MKHTDFRKLLIVPLMIILFAVPAAYGRQFDLNMHLGLVSGAGVSMDAGRWQFGMDLETTFPVYCIVNGISGEVFNDLPFWEGFRMGLSAFFGADAYAYFRIAGQDAFRLYAGLDVMFGTEPPIRSFETVLRPTVKLSYVLNDKTCIFAAGGFSLLDIMYVPGFRKPLVRIPDAGYASVLTGCRLGVSVNI